MRALEGAHHFEFLLLNSSQMLKKIVALLSILACIPGMAFAEGFLIKGVRLGDTEEAVCGSATIINQMEDIRTSMREHGVELKPQNTTECEGSIESFGGIKLLSPSHMLFLDQKLIALKIATMSMDSKHLLKVMEAMIEEFGKPARSKSSQYITFTWRRWGQTLTLEVENAAPDESFLILILKDDQKYAHFERLHHANIKMIKAASQRSMRNDILK